MTAYAIVRIESDNPDLLKEYRAATPSILKKFGGEFIVRGGDVKTFEGPEETRRMVLIEFPSMQHAEDFFHSAEYSAARKLREGIAEFEFIAVDGLNEE